MEVSYQVWSHEASTFFLKNGRKTDIFPVLQNLTHMTLNCSEILYETNQSTWQSTVEARVSRYEILFCTRTGQSAQLAAPQSLQPSLIPSPSPNSAHNILVSCIFHPALSPFYIYPHPHLAIEKHKTKSACQVKDKI